MTNYQDVEARLQRLEQQVLDIKKKLEALERWLSELEQEVEPAVTAQRIRDEWDGLG